MWAIKRLPVIGCSQLFDIIRVAEGPRTVITYLPPLRWLCSSSTLYHLSKEGDCIMFASHSGRINYIDLGMGTRPLECSALGLAQPDMPALPRTLLLATCLRSALPSYTTFSMKRSYPKSGPSSNSLASKLRASNHWHVLPYTYMYFCFLEKALGMPLTSLK